ncbi:common central domain of tyrosinase-domain-containing protein [Aspergillus carlsbadensis]|nr:common central domain of tyrosinase-domain-containing protein [Aspergillus carlsbadensis]
MPFRPWDEPHEVQESVSGKGYSMYGNYLFSSWNRVYILLFEQRLHDIMLETIIPQYAEEYQEILQGAAQKWRLPYWDWATSSLLPALALQPEIRFKLCGQVEALRNPLYQFCMPNRKTMGSRGIGKVEFRHGEVTSFYSDSVATSRPKMRQQPPFNRNENPWLPQHCHGSYQSDRGTLADMVYRTLTLTSDYGDFSTTAFDIDQSYVLSAMSLESVTLYMHSLIGGDNGNLGQIPVASFDPMFWLLRCNVDRLWALWQELNPDSWFTEGYGGDYKQGTVGLPTTVTPKTALRPFHRDQWGQYWMSDHTRNFRSLGYTYPDLDRRQLRYPPGVMRARKTYQTELFESIIKMYGESRIEPNTNVPITGLLKPVSDGVNCVEQGIIGVDFSVYLRFSRPGTWNCSAFNIELYHHGPRRSLFEHSHLIGNIYNFEVDDGEADRTGEQTLYALLDREIRWLASAHEPLDPVPRDIETILEGLHWRVTLNRGQPVPEETSGELGIQLLIQYIS